MDRVEREADGPKVAILRPKHGWMRQQLRYLVPAAAVAVLVVVVVRYGGRHPGASTPIAPPAVIEPAAPVTAGQRVAKAEPESLATKKAESAAVARHAPPTAIDGLVPRQAGTPRILESRPPPIAGDSADGQGRLGAGAGRDAPGSKAPADGSPPVTAAEGISKGMQAERKKMAGAADLMAEQHVAGKAKSASGMRIATEPSPDGHGWPSAGAGKDATGSVAPAGPPCSLARTLAERERFPEAEAAQRACLAGNLPAPSREKGLVFLAELLDRQARFAEADAVIAEVDRRFPRSTPLDLYRRQRPMVQKKQVPAPIPR
jgi:hypothetical protein